jgi:hypothetical protein
MQPEQSPGEQPSGAPKSAGPLKSTYNAWSGYTFLKAQGIEKSGIKPLRAVAAAVFLGLTGLQAADAFVSPEPHKAVIGAAGSLVIGGALMWGLSAIEVGLKKAMGSTARKPSPPKP